MWFAWVIALLAILSILTVMIIIPLFGAWYTSSIIFIVVGIIIIILGALWFNSITGLPTDGLTLNPDEERFVAIASIFFGFLMIVIGIVLASYRYLYRRFPTTYSREVCKDLILDSNDSDCNKKYPDILENYIMIRETINITPDQCLDIIGKTQPGDDNYKLCRIVYPKIVKDYEITLNMQKQREAIITEIKKKEQERMYNPFNKCEIDCNTAFIRHKSINELTECLSQCPP